MIFLELLSRYSKFYPVDITAARIPRERILKSIHNSESLDYNTKFINTLPDIYEDANNDVTSESEEINIFIPLKNLSNFIFSLDFSMINTDIELIFKWSRDCVLTSKSARRGLSAGDDAALLPAVNEINRPKDLKFNITDCTLYVPLVTLQERYDMNYLKI